MMSRASSRVGRPVGLFLGMLALLGLTSGAAEAATINVTRTFDLDDGSAFSVGQYYRYVSGSIDLGEIVNVQAGDTVILDITFAPGQALWMNGDSDVVFFGAEEAMGVQMTGTSNNTTSDYKSTYTSQTVLNGIVGTPFVSVFNDSNNVNNLGTVNPTLRNRSFAATTNIVDGAFSFTGFTTTIGPITRLDDANDSPITFFADAFSFDLDADQLVVTPEPGTSLLLGLGLAGLAAARRRRG